MRFFDWLTVAIHFTMSLAWFCQWRINRSLIRTLQYQRMMTGTIGAMAVHSQLEKYIGKPIPPIDPADLKKDV